MENYANAMPTIFFEEDQMLQHQRQQRQQTKKHMKSIRRSRPDCFTVVPEYLKKNQHQLETSSSSSSDSEDEFNATNFLKSRKRFSQKQIDRRSRPECFTVMPEYLKKKQHQLENSSCSSSSSSSSDSEDEFNTCKRNTIPKYMKWSQQQQQQHQQTPKWFTLVDLEGFRPQEVTAKVNAKCRILVIKAKSNSNSHLNQQRQMEMEEEITKGKIVRVIPLPDNICLEKLRVQVLPREGRLLVKAPFTSHGEEGVQQQGRFLPTWIPIRVTLKQGEEDFNTDKRHSRYQQQQQQQQRYFPTGFFFNQMEKDFQQTSTTSNSLLKVTEIIRDETTGKPLMLVKVNTFGFRAEEIRVRVDETKRVLIVEAIKRNIREGQMQMEQGLTMKYLRREFVLPQWLNVTRITFRVLKNGLLIVKLPIVKQNKMLHNTNFTTRFGCENKTFGDFNMQKQHKKEWEKPLRA